MNLHKPLPCKKCISYAMCINRKRIACDRILNFLSLNRPHVNWNEINITLPKVNSLEFEDPRHSNIFKLKCGYKKAIHWSKK